jgi:hypothetical protein
MTFTSSRFVRSPLIHGGGIIKAVAASGLTLISLGVDEAAATSFTLNPTTLGAAVGDIMVVAAAWETGTQEITPPGSPTWTESVDQESTEGGGSRRVSLHTIKFAGSVPADQTFSYAGSNGVAYAWCILRGAASVESVSYSDGDTSASVGADSITVSLTGDRIAAFVAACADGGVETGETAAFSGVDQEVNSSFGHLAGRYALAGYVESSVTASYTTTQIPRAGIGNYLVYFQ